MSNKDDVDNDLYLDLYESIIYVVEQRKVSFDKKNVKNVCKMLAKAVSTLYTIVGLDFQEFLDDAKSVDKSLDKNQLTEIYNNFKDKLSQYKDSFSSEKNNLSASESDALALYSNIFNNLYNKSIEIMKEKNLLVKDVPVLITCLGCLGAYFCSLYGFDTSQLINAINTYDKSLSSALDKDLDKKVEQTTSIPVNSKKNHGLN